MSAKQNRATRVDGEGLSETRKTVEPPGVQGMVFVPAGSVEIGSSRREREQAALTFGCDATWLNDELEQRAVALPAFWIDRSPVTNAEYLAFTEATGHRRPWIGGTFSPDRADHPVVGVSARDAAAFATWLGKRLPTAEEWEVAARPASPGAYPWGGDWPGPVRLAGRDGVPVWDAPATRPVGMESASRSAVGVDDLAGQVCEWTATTRTHHGGTFHLLKGASWLHEDPVNFRIAAGSWISATFRTPLLGFRCALDGNSIPPPVPRASPVAAAPSPSQRARWASRSGSVRVYYAPHAPERVRVHLLDVTRTFLGGREGRSRGFLLSAPALYPWSVALYFAETMVWNGEQVLAGTREQDPPLAVRMNAGSPKADSYGMDFSEFGVEIRFAPAKEHVDLVTTVTNKTRSSGVYKVSSCLSLTSHPFFYDCEMLRTYQLTGGGAFEALRRTPRTGDCVRWIAASDFSGHGGEPRAGVMAVASRDGRWTFASARIEPDAADSIEVIGNPWLNCLHTDAPVTVPPTGTRTTTQRLYFLAGGLDDLMARINRDFVLQDLPVGMKV